MTKLINKICKLKTFWRCFWDIFKTTTAVFVFFVLSMKSGFEFVAKTCKNTVKTKHNVGVIKQAVILSNY